MMRVWGVLRAAVAAGRRVTLLSFLFLSDHGILFYLVRFENANIWLGIPLIFSMVKNWARALLGGRDNDLGSGGCALQCERTLGCIEQLNINIVWKSNYNNGSRILDATMFPRSCRCRRSRAFHVWHWVKERVHVPAIRRVHNRTFAKNKKLKCPSYTSYVRLCESRALQAHIVNLISERPTHSVGDSFLDGCADFHHRWQGFGLPQPHP